MGIRPCKKIVQKLLKGKKFKNILELGCQWSENLIPIKDKFPDTEVWGIDNDETVLWEAKRSGIITELGDANRTRFEDKSFDIVFTNALFCMLHPHEVEPVLKEMVRLAKKHIILIELECSTTGYVRGGRTGANFIELFKNLGLTATKRKITEEEWGVNPWLNYGYVYECNL